MRAEALTFELAPVPDNDIEARTAPRPDPDLADLRFRALLRDRDWSSLPGAIRRRFSKRLPHGGTTVYAGEILETRMSFPRLAAGAGAAADRRPAADRALRRTCRAS